MKEEFVSYECAQRLKELGFNYDCRGYYHYDDVSKVMVLSTPLNHNNKNLFKSICSAPRLDEAQKWLREVKGIHVLPRLENVNKPDYACIITLMRKECLRIIDNDKYFQNYESALSAGLDASLKLLTENQ